MEKWVERCWWRSSTQFLVLGVNALDAGAEKKNSKRYSSVRESPIARSLKGAAFVGGGRQNKATAEAVEMILRSERCDTGE
jgi:hypothetical protein